MSSPIPAMRHEDGWPALSVCVIGRNEGRHLAQAAASLALLSEAGLAFETIYVDSASDDGSAAIADALFDCVIVLAAHASLNAGAARHIATCAARGHWVLYLDGDMELLADMVGPIAALVGSGDHQQGLCGYTVNHFDDGGVDRIEYRGNRHGQPCRGFGGAVLLPRQAVLDAGNWPLALFSYEESHLQACLDRRVRILWYACDFVKHKTPRIGNWRKLSGLMWPASSYLGKKFYGPGQVTRLALAQGRFLRFLTIRPGGYAVLGGLGASFAALPWSPAAALGVAIVILGPVLAHGLRPFVAALSWVPQIGFGWSRLDRQFAPSVKAMTDMATREARIAARHGRHDGRALAGPPLAASLDMKEGTA